MLDVGANTGEYSVLLAGKGAAVVALERDVEAADRLYVRSRREGLFHPDDVRGPGQGRRRRWAGAMVNTARCWGRLEGQFDLVLMLAVIHHLLLMEQIPLRAIVQLCAQMTRRWLVVEWVPVVDPMFQSLMRGRESLYGSLCEDDLLAACAGCFEVRERRALGNGRVLLLLEKVSRVLKKFAQSVGLASLILVMNYGDLLGGRRRCADACAVWAGRDCGGAADGYPAAWAGDLGAGDAGAQDALLHLGEGGAGAGGASLPALPDADAFAVCDGERAGAGVCSGLGRRWCCCCC